MRRRIVRLTLWSVACVYAGMCIAMRAIDGTRGI